MISLNSKKLKYFIFGICTMFMGLGINAVSAHQFTNYYGIQMTNDEYFTLLNTLIPFKWIVYKRLYISLFLN